MEEPNTGMPVPGLKSIKFDLMSSKDVKKFSSATITEASDVTGAQLGLPNQTGAQQCKTCGSQSGRDCDGHCGVIKLPKHVFNPYVLEETVQLLNHICPGCHTPKKNRDSKRSDGATSQATCKYCSKDGTKQYPDVIFKTLTSPRIILSKNKILLNPSVMDKISVTAEVVDRVTDKFKNNCSSEILPQDYWDFVPYHNPSQSNMTNILMSPNQVFHILKQLDPKLISRFVSRRDLVFLSSLPVTANCHRVAEMPYGFSDGPRLVYDDRTKAYKRTVDAVRKIDHLCRHPLLSFLASSLVAGQVMECLQSSKARELISSFLAISMLTD